jgi:hypothetical protein
MLYVQAPYVRLSATGLNDTSTFVPTRIHIYESLYIYNKSNSSTDNHQPVGRFFYCLLQRFCRSSGTSYNRYPARHISFVVQTSRTHTNRNKATMTTTRLCRLLILFACVQVGVVSFSDGAGGCSGNAAAVKGFHLDTLGGTRKVTTGSLQTGGLSLVVNGAVIPNGGTVTVEAEALNALFVMGMSDYRGILMRLESLTTGVDATTFLTPLGGGTANAEACAALNKKEIVGVTHKDGDLKNRLASVLNVSQNNLGMYNLDITVVVKNSDTSVYYHTQYKVNVVKTTKPPTKAPKVMMGMGTYFL